MYDIVQLSLNKETCMTDMFKRKAYKGWQNNNIYAV